MTVLTTTARRSRRPVLDDLGGVASRPELARLGIDRHEIDAHLRNGRWRSAGTAIVLHNGPLTSGQRARVALINCGPRSALTSFTAAAAWGLTGWERDDIHVLAPGGATRPAVPGLVLHRTREWPAASIATGRRLHRLAPALLLAAAGFATARPGCGILAAGVQQRLVTPTQLATALDAAPRVRHRAALVHAVEDIAQGAHALSEIDLRRLCARHGLPLPVHQAVRVEPNGRRRYLDGEWRLPDGRIVAVEVDGALHLRPLTWIEDQLRQNEVVIGGTPVLRFPSIVVRTEEHVVVAQLARLLGVR